MFYATRGASQIDNTEQQPFVLDNTINQTNGLVSPYGANDPFPYNSNLTNPVFYSGATISGVRQNASFPYVMEYNLTLEQQLPGDFGARIGYVGSQSRRFFLSHGVNEPAFVPGAPTTAAGLAARRPCEPTPATYLFQHIV